MTLLVLTYNPEFEEFPKIYYHKLDQVYVMVENINIIHKNLECSTDF